MLCTLFFSFNSQTLARIFLFVVFNRDGVTISLKENLIV